MIRMPIALIVSGLMNPFRLAVVTMARGVTYFLIRCNEWIVPIASNDLVAVSTH